MQDVAFLADEICVPELCSAAPRHRHDPRTAMGLDGAEAFPAPCLWELAFDEVDRPRRIRPVRRASIVEELAQDLLNRPGHRRHRRDAEALVDLGAARIVDTSDNDRDAIGIPCDPGRKDVRVVPARHRHKAPCSRGPGGLEVVPVKTHADDLDAPPVRCQAPERGRILVDDADGVAPSDELLGKTGSDSAAADDDDVHSSMQHGPGHAHNSPGAHGGKNGQSWDR